MTRIVLLIGFIGLSVGSLLAQSLTKQADRQFAQSDYVKAANLYEQALTNPASLSDSERRIARERLAYSYYQARDTKSAEQAYRNLIAESGSSAESGSYYLHYAQALASNGKFREAQIAYDKCDELKAAGPQSIVSSKLSQDVTSLTRTAGKYTVDFLDLNTRKPEFSPMLYKNGLAFVSTGSKNWGKLFKRSNTHFLDLYYLPEADALRGEKTSAKGMAVSLAGQMLGRDKYTTPTANDSKTIGFSGATNLGPGYEDQSVDESERFGKGINSKYHEGPATFSRDGSRVIFTRNNYTDGEYRESKDGVNKLKLYTATQTNGSWSEPEELPFNSEEFSTGHPSLASGRNGEPDQLLYFSSDRPGGFGGTDVYVSTWTNGKWGEPVNLGKEVNSKENELFPFIDEKGNLYVASNGHGGLGGLDLFYVPLVAASQSAGPLLNLGEPLNSPKDDFGIVTDGMRNRGYLSSNRKNGGADDDIYRFLREGSLHNCRELIISVFDAETKEPLTNTSIALETPSGDHQKELTTDANGLVRVCLTVDNDTRFLISREGYMANKIGFSANNLSDTQSSRLDIALAKPGFGSGIGAQTLQGQLLTQAGRNPIAGANVALTNECDGKVEEITTDGDGRYTFAIDADCNYLLEATKKNMGTTGARYTKNSSGTVDLLMFKKGDIITIDNIHYDLNKADIRPDAAAELDKVVALMNKYPTMTIEMRSHTDSRATAQYNKTLSGNRAKAAVTYLKSKGVAAKRMVAKGYGESALLNTCTDGADCSEVDHQKNRRTEIKILTLQ